tara:strand:- start:10311 stop:10532 length:222 start_codon:yes stop_codon:yes gene_type:complete
MPWDLDVTTDENDARRYSDYTRAAMMSETLMRVILGGSLAYKLAPSQTREGDSFVIRCERCGVYVADSGESLD